MIPPWVFLAAGVLWVLLVLVVWAAMVAAARTDRRLERERRAQDQG